MNMMTLCAERVMFLSSPAIKQPSLSDVFRLRYVPFVRANQIVCQFPNANCAILVSRQNQLRNPLKSPRTRLRTSKPPFRVMCMIKRKRKKRLFRCSYCNRIFFAYSHGYTLSSDGDALAAGGNRLGCNSVCILRLVGIISLCLLGAGLALQKATLLDRTTGLDARDGAVVLGDAGSGAVHRGGEVGNVLGDGVLRSDSTSVDAVALTGLGHGIVPRVEVLAVLEMLGEVVGSGGQLAVEAEKTLLLGSE